MKVLNSKSLFFFTLFFLIHSSTYAQQYAAELIPKSLKSRATAVVRDEVVNIDMKNESNISHHITKAVTVLNKSGDQHGALTLFYDKTKSIKDIKGLIYDEFGKQIGKFSVKDFKDYSATDQVSMFDDIRVKHYAPNVYTYPYTVVYTYEVKHNQNLFIPYWRPNVQADLAIEKSSFTFSSNSNLKLRLKSQHVLEPTIHEDNGKTTTYTWTVSNINARKNEPFSPLIYKDEVFVKIVPETFQFFKKQGTVNTWHDMGKWMYEELLENKQDLPQSTKDMVIAMTAHVSSPQEKAKILYQYLQNKTRYVSVQVGLGGIEPYPASYVDKLGYGDCKALVNYMQALLNTVGIESLYCIVEAGNDKISLDENFANVVDGNHIILCLPFENDTTWLECTSNKNPFGYLGDFTDDRLVLACGSSGGKILRTPSYTPDQNTQLRKAHLTVKEDGSLEGTVNTIFAGTQFDNHYPNVFKSPNDQVKALKSYYDIDNITFHTCAYTVEDPKGLLLIEDLDISVKNYIVKNASTFILMPNLFNTIRPIVESKNRVNEVYINRGYKDVDEIHYTFESKLAGKIVPLDTTIECPMGRYELKVLNDEQGVTMTRIFQLNQGLYPPEDYSKFFEFMKEVAAMDKIKYTLNMNF